MKQVVEYLALATLATFLVVKGIIPAWREVHSDFANYYVSAKLVVDGAPLDKLYDNDWFQQRIVAYGINSPGKFSPFPPLTAWMMVPLTLLGPLTAQRAFMLINLIFIVFGIILLKQITQWELKHCALLILGSGLSLVNNIAFGQVYWIMTVFILFSIYLHKKNYPVLAGIILGIFAALKYFPIVFIAGYFLNGLFTKKKETASASFLSSSDFRLVISSLFTLVTLVVLQFSFFGNSLMHQFISSAFLPHLDGRLTGQGLYSFGFQSWDNLFRNLFVADPQFNPAPFIDWPSGKTIMKVSVILVVSGLTLLILYRYKDAAFKIRRAIALALPALTAFVVLPASATYHFVMLIIPLIILFGERIIVGTRKTIIIALYVSIGFVPYGLAFQLSKSWGLFFAYPRLWLICTVYLVVIWCLIKKKELIFAS